MTGSASAFIYASPQGPSTLGMFSSFLIHAEWRNFAVQKEYIVVPKNSPVIRPGAIVCATIVCRSSSAHRFRQNSCSNYVPIRLHRLCSRWTQLGRRTEAASRPQRKVLLIQFWYGRFDPDTEVNEVREVCNVQVASCAHVRYIFVS